MNRTRIPLWCRLLIAGLAAASCAPSGGGGGGGGPDCSGDFVIHGTAVLDSGMVAGPTIDNPGGFPQEGKAWLIGIPSEQATVSATDGTFCLALTSAQVTDAGLAAGDAVDLIVWWVAQSFLEMVAVRTNFDLAADNNVQTVTLTWIKALHVNAAYGDSGSTDNVNFPGITDAAAHGFQMFRSPSPATGWEFDTNYLPEGTYDVEITTTNATTYVTTLTFPAGDPSKGEDQWQSLNSFPLP